MGYEQLPPYDNPPIEARTRGLMCSDQKGQVQIVAPESALVDPEPIVAATARELKSVPINELEPICAIPGFYGVPTVVHSGLKQESVLALATETPGKYVRATGQEVYELCNSHVSFETDLAAELKPTPIDTSGDEDDILGAVEEFTLRRIEARLDETLHIPPLPEAARRIIELQRDPNFDLSDLVKIVETDPAIAARILGWANSALYAAPSPVKTLNDAIMRVLGFDVVFNMAIGLAIGATLNLPKSHVSGAAPFWLDAVYTAATMEALANQRPKSPDLEVGTCYLAGLLANFGTLVVGHVFPPQYDNICRMQEANPHIHHSYVDQHVLSVNRETIAASLLELWELPDEITTSLRFQHVPDYEGEHQSLVHLLSLAQSLLADQIHTANPDEFILAPEIYQRADALNIEAKNLELVAETILAARQDLGDLAHEMSR